MGLDFATIVGAIWNTRIDPQRHDLFILVGQAFGIEFLKVVGTIFKVLFYICRTSFSLRNSNRNGTRPKVENICFPNNKQNDFASLGAPLGVSETMKKQT